MKFDRLDSMLGMATKAGKTVSGEGHVLSAVRSGKAFLVCVSSDASEATKKKFQDKCSYFKVPLFYYGDKDRLGAVTGKAYRAVLAVIDEGFAGKIIELLSKEEHR